MTVSLDVHYGRVIALFARLRRRSTIEREFRAELERFVEVAGRPDAEASPASRYGADSTAGWRILTVLATDPGIVHARLHAGVLQGEPDGSEPGDPIAPARAPDPLAFLPLEPPFRRALQPVATGQPLLRLDGGLGVDHLALTATAWTDARARRLDLEPLTDDDSAAVAAWRERGAPVFGRDLDLRLAPLVTLRLGDRFRVAKVLKTEFGGVHLRLYADRWVHRPGSVKPWRLTQRPVALTSLPRRDDLDLGPFSVDHLPLSHGAFRACKPEVAAPATLQRFELEPYHAWKATGGGWFA